MPRRKTSTRIGRTMRASRSARKPLERRSLNARKPLRERERARDVSLTVADRLAIQDLLARYAWALDTGDVEGFVACFTPDAMVTEEVFEEPDRWEGHANLRRLAEHYKGVPDFPGRQHHVSQVLVEGSAQSCRVRSYIFVTECRGEPPYIVRFAGYYEDRVVKGRAGWLFKERIIRLWDGPALARFPGHDGTRVPRKRPPQLIISRV